MMSRDTIPDQKQATMSHLSLFELDPETKTIKNRHNDSVIQKILGKTVAFLLSATWVRTA